MTMEDEINWNGKIALKIEMYAREIFNFGDLNKNIKFYYNSGAAETRPYEKLQHMLNKIFKDGLNDEAIKFITTYSKFDGKSLREMGKKTSFEMLENFEKILFKYRKDLIL